MATQGERRALMFLAAVALLGAGTRAWRAKSKSTDNRALAVQIEAVDSAAAGPRSKRGRTGSGRARSPKSDPGVTKPPVPIDLDVAPAEEIERLPGIGPALARRIVQDRSAKGAFGCAAALDSVKGIGPALLARLDSMATFSGLRRPICLRGDPAGSTARS